MYVRSVCSLVCEMKYIESTVNLNHFSTLRFKKCSPQSRSELCYLILGVRYKIFIGSEFITLYLFIPVSDIEKDYVIGYPI